MKERKCKETSGRLSKNLEDRKEMSKNGEQRRFYPDLVKKE